MDRSRHLSSQGDAASGAADVAAGSTSSANSSTESKKNQSSPTMTYAFAQSKNNISVSIPPSKSGFQEAQKRKRKLQQSQKEQPEQSHQDLTHVHSRPKKSNDDKRKEQNRKAAIASRYRKRLLMDELQDSIKFFEKLNREQKKKNEHLEKCILDAHQYIDANHLTPTGAADVKHQTSEQEPYVPIVSQQNQLQLLSKETTRRPQQEQQVHVTDVGIEHNRHTFAPMTAATGTTMDAMVAFQMAVDAAIGQQHRRPPTVAALNTDASFFRHKDDDESSDQNVVKSNTAYETRSAEIQLQEFMEKNRQPNIAINESGSFSNIHGTTHQLVTSSENDYNQANQYHTHQQMFPLWQQQTHQALIQQQQSGVIFPSSMASFLPSMLAQHSIPQLSIQPFSQFFNPFNPSLSLNSASNVSTIMSPNATTQQQHCQPFIQEAESFLEQERQRQHHLEAATGSVAIAANHILAMMDHSKSSNHNNTTDSTTAACNNMWAAAAAAAAAAMQLRQQMTTPSACLNSSAPVHPHPFLSFQQALQQQFLQQSNDHNPSSIQPQPEGITAGVAGNVVPNAQNEGNKELEG